MKVKALTAIISSAVMITCGAFGAAALTDGGDKDPSSQVLSIAGDVDGNGEVNLVDYGLLKVYLSGKTVAIDPAAADVDNNGTVDENDRVVMQGFFAGSGAELK